MAKRQGSEERVQALGRRLLKAMRKRGGASWLDRGFWQEQVMAWSMRDEAFKTELFRFVDVFPALRGDAAQVARHLREYFARPGQGFPRVLRWGTGAIGEGWLARRAARQIERRIGEMARRFIAGVDARDALAVLERLRGEGVGFTVDLLGEACVSEEEADDYLRRYLEMIDGLATATAGWKPDPRVEGARAPRVNISIKLSALYSQLDPMDPAGSARGVKARLRPILERAAARGVFVNLDVESYAYKTLTHDIFCEVLEEAAFREAPGVGCVVQAYLVEAEGDLERLIGWAKRRERPITIRLVKGAYWDYETIRAQQHGWPAPVLLDKRATDAQFERLSGRLIEAAPLVTPAIASHNVRSLAVALERAERRGLTRDDFEVQVLYGMADSLRAALVDQGVRVRSYVPVGELVPGMAYLVRRLLENTSNESWLRKGSFEKASARELLAPPEALAPSRPALVDVTRGAPRSPGLGPFVNEPGADFTQAEARQAMGEALVAVRRRLGRVHPIVIDGRRVRSDEQLVRCNPARPDEVIGRAHAATRAHARQAVAAAERAFPAWRDAPVERRVGLLVDVAARMREARWRLAALIVLEVGKGWREADADVCEAIDFLEYYAREMLRLAAPQRMGHHPGELNHYFYEPRGVCAVIAPWNFPLAILAGMCSAALVTGNTVIMKPAEQSVVIAAELMGLFEAAGVPAGVLAFLPGRGEVVGAELAAHPRVVTLAFTGSLAVGLELQRQVGVTLPGQPAIKRLIGEFGGKNAIIVDDDADLDEAVEGVVESAFGYQGQKCSACSRVIVLGNQYEAFVSRLAEATRSLRAGPPEDPGHRLGPVVDAEAREKILDYIALGRRHGRVIAQCDVPDDGGLYVPATVIAEVAPDARVAQEEIFGPVLCVLRADDFEAALDVALASPYALTGGLYSRSPSNIARARERFRVGNLYINRSCTGALVWRQPFGGFARSGVGSKAGGPDYLLQFMVPRVITENTMRRGFAPIDAVAPGE